MRPSQHLSTTIQTAICALIAAFCTAPASASDFYLSANLGISGGKGASGGNTQFFSNSGSDTDSSPVYGGTLGWEVGLDEIVALMPTGTEHKFRRWALRSEIEGAAGRDYELITMGAEPYVSVVSSWSVMVNQWFDVPIHPPIARLFGRVPLLEPLTFYVGAGVGLGALDVTSSDNVSFGREKSYDFAWQAGTGFNYELTPRVSLGFGYRYHDLGEIDVPLQLGPTPFGNLNLDLEAHEIATSLRIRFWSVSLRGER